MKKLFTLLLCGVVFTSLQAQNLIAKVPASATMVIKYAGENFSKNMSVQKLDSYGFIKNNLFKMLHVDTLTSIQNTGINLEQDNYQYIATDDSTLTFVTLLHLKNAAQFLQFIKASYGAKNTTEQKNGFQFLSISDNTYIGWNDNVATIVNAIYQNKESYYTHKYKTDTAAVTTAVTDAVDSAAAEVVDAVKAPPVKFTKPKIVKDGYKAPKKNGQGKKKPAAKKGTAKKKVVPKKKVYDDMETTEDMAISTVSVEDSIEDRKRDLWDQQQDMLAKKKQQAAAESVMASAFVNQVQGIENVISYKKIIEPAAHVSIWINSDNLINQYQNYFSRDMYSLLRYAKPIYNKDSSSGFKSAVNVYFEKDRMRMEQKSFSDDAEMASLGKGMMNSKQNNSLVNFVNPGNIGYFSMSINTEAMINYYYATLKKYLSNSSYMSAYSDVVNVYIDLVQIMIDEKGIADLMPGNYLFVMHDMKTKMVEYIDYTYDAEYKQTEVKKKKKELSPNFTFVMETKREDFMQKLAKLPIKYAEKEKYNYKEKNGYYELALDSTKYPISSLYFIVRDGKALVTTSKEVVDNTIANKGFAVDVDTKASILNNNYSIKIDSKKLFEILGTEASTKANKKICAYMKENMGDIKTESSYKDGMIQGTSIIKINGNHANSLEFIFNAIEAINNIVEEERADESKKVD
jgi:hypothetical protein